MPDAQNQEDFAAFAAGHRLTLLRFALALDARSTQDAEDLVQQALVRVAERWSTIVSPLPFARTVLARLAIDRGRSAVRRRETIGLIEFTDGSQPPLHAATRASAQDPAQRIADSDRVVRLLRTLPPRQRQALILRFMADLSEADTAQILGCPLGTVKSEVFRGLRSLRALDEG